MDKVLSQWRIKGLRELLEQLNKVPHEVRKEWGHQLQYTNFDHYIEVCDALLERMKRNSERVKKYH